jgi:hypothetical protein
MRRSAFAILGALFVAHAASAQFAQQGDKLRGANAIGAVAQGSAVAISADGDTAVVGGPNDNAAAGAAWVYGRTGGAWSRQGPKLVGTGASGPAGQGCAVAISGDGNTVIIGGNTDNSNTGAVWVFTRSAGSWSQQGGKLVAGDAAGSPKLGSSVSISSDGNTAIVGGPSDHSGLGAAFVFRRHGVVWSQQGSKLVGTGAVGTSAQGQSVAISADGGTAIVGGYGDNNSVGAAWMFTLSNGVWSQQGSKLLGRDVAGIAYQGSSVDLSSDGSTAVVGGSQDNSDVGAAWIFTRGRLGGWAQEGSKLVGTGANASSGQGFSVGVSGDGNTVVVGGPNDSPTGAAWVFTRNGSVWTQLGSKLVGSGVAGNASQGWSASLSWDGGTVIVGGPGDGSNVGAAWVFSAPAFSVWVPVASHNPGKNGSQWRSDLGLLNTGTATANVDLKFFGSSVVSSSTFVPAGAQSILTDVVGQLNGVNSGALEVLSDQPIRITARTYNQASSTAGCYPNGTQGQDYPALATGDGLAPSQSAYLAGLTENASYRCNIGLVNTGTGSATVLVELYNGAGTRLASYSVSLTAGQWAQETQPFLSKAGQTAMDRGYARVTVQTGSGVFAFASVIDNLTNDPTTVAMQR